MILALSLCVLTQGCGSLQKTTYSTVSTSVPTIQTVMGVWDKYVEDGKATVQQERTVKKALDTYRLSGEVVCSAAKQFAVDNDQNKYLAAVRGVTESFSSLQTIVNLYTGKH